MPKRNYENNLDYYRRKVKKLEDQQRRKRRRIFIESSSDSDENTSRNSSPIPEAIPLETEAITDNIEDVVASALEETSTPKANDDISPDIDPELLLALGEEAESEAKFGEPIHRTLAQRWEPILRKGLAKEIKEKLMKEYLPPENCTLLQAPKLNREVAAAITESSRQRDKKMETTQQQLGIGISVMNKALTLMLTGDDKIKVIKILSDGCRILTDLHHHNTQARKCLINHSLAKPFLNVVQDSERDETLYGIKLGEKIKASKTIEKQGLSIKKFVKTDKNKTNTDQPSTAVSRPYQTRQSTSYQGNWSGSSRYQQNRGGHRRPNRTTAPVARRTSAQQSSSAPGSSKAKTSAARQ